MFDRHVDSHPHVCMCFHINMANTFLFNQPPPEIEWFITNLAGIHHIVQAQIRQLIGHHLRSLKGYNVNSAIVHASKEPLVRHMMNTVQQITFSFNYSTQRLHVFQTELEIDEDAHAGINNKTNLQSLCM